MAKEIDHLVIPIYATFETLNGVQTDSSMFYKSDIILLRFTASADNKEHSIFVIRPDKFDDSNKNYFDLKTKTWKF